MEAIFVIFVGLTPHIQTPHILAFFQLFNMQSVLKLLKPYRMEQAQEPELVKRIEFFVDEMMAVFRLMAEGKG